MSDSKPRSIPSSSQGETAVLRKIEELASSSVPDRRSGVRLGIGDDAALFAPRRGFELILTCDWFLEGMHFWRARHPPDVVGWKALARAVSDISAMGGEPRCFLMSLALPTELTGLWLADFLGGMRRAAKRFGCFLAGGDTTRRSEVLINLTAVGEVRKDHAVLRTGARPGDIVFVSGRLGEAELGLRLLRRSKSRFNKNDARLHKHLYPEPRLELGAWLAANKLASAMMDLSDGLSTDLPRLCAASGVGVEIEAANLPVLHLSKGAHSARLDPLKLALNGGEDYELLFTVPRRRLRRLPRFFRGIPLIAIGKITATRKLTILDSDGRDRPIPNAGWDPFRE